LPWGNDAIPTYEARQVYPKVFGTAGVFLLLIVAWVLERHRRERESTRICFATGWALGVMISFILVAMTGWAIYLLVQIILFRHTLSLVADNTTGENSWGFGEICAPFAWLPVVIEMI
jgi:hypothetical protein